MTTNPRPPRTASAARLAAMLALLALPRAAHAQRLQGRVIDTTTEAPVAGAALQLVAADSIVAVYGISDEAGGFTLIAQRPGEYTLRIARPGYQSAVLGPLPLERGKTLEVTVALGVDRTPVDTAAVAGPRIGRRMAPAAVRRAAARHASTER